MDTNFDSSKTHLHISLIKVLTLAAESNYLITLSIYMEVNIDHA